MLTPCTTQRGAWSVTLLVLLCVTGCATRPKHEPANGPPARPAVEREGPFLSAVKRGDEAAVLGYLRAGVSPDTRHPYYDGLPALGLAAKRLKGGTARLLIEHGADVNAADTNGLTALTLVCLTDRRDTSVPLARLLVRHGAKLNALSNELRWDDRDNIVCINPLLAAIHVSNEEMARFLIEAGADIDVCTPQGHAPLLLAIRTHQNGLAKHLVGRGAKVLTRSLSRVDGMTLDAEVREEHSALLAAVDADNLEMVDFLLQQGMDVNDASGGRRATHTDGGEEQVQPSQTPLTLACAQRKLHAVRYLMGKGADPNGTGGQGEPLHAAVRALAPEIAAFLIEKGAGVNAKDPQGNTPLLALVRMMNLLHALSAWGGLDFASEKPEVPPAGRLDPSSPLASPGLRLAGLLVDAGADVNASDALGCTALMLAADMGFRGMVEMLLAHGAALGMTNNSGETALLLAARNGHDDLCRLLIEKGADRRVLDEADLDLDNLPRPVAQPLVMKGLYGGRMSARAQKAPLTERARKMAAERRLVRALEKGDSDVALLAIGAGADVNLRTSKINQSTVALAAKKGMHAVLAALVSAGADVNRMDRLGAAGLHYAIDAEDLQALELLADAGADLDLPGGEDARADGTTRYLPSPLESALTKCSSPDMADFLAARGADANVDVAFDSTLLGAAARGGDEWTVAFLLRHGADLTAEDDFTVSLVRVLTERARDADLNVVDRDGFNLLQWTVLRGHADLARTLMARGMDINAVTRYGVPTLFLGLFQGLLLGQSETIEALIAGGADLTIRNAFGQTCMQVLDELARDPAAVFPPGLTALWRQETKNETFEDLAGSTERIRNLLLRAGATLTREAGNATVAPP
ncbi:MAG: ankyrin repeat domain-containing protein [Kiritimatiellae bacterium]|nr:ankyrin repeat domain-containing protein [Kiritimatiellia bacterium]